MLSTKVIFHQTNLLQSVSSLTTQGTRDTTQTEKHPNKNEVTVNLQQQTEDG